MDMNADAAAVPASPEAPAMSFPQRLVGIFFEPKRTFEDIHRKGGWLGMFLLMSALSMAATYSLTSRMSHEQYIEKALAMNPLTKSMSEEQKQALINRPAGPAERFSAAIAPLSLIVGYAILAGIYLLLFILMGAGISYKKSLAVTVWGSVPPGIVLVILSLVLMWTKDPADLELNVANNVASNLGWLVDSKAHPALSSLLSSVDLFSIWTIALLSIGFAVVSSRKITTGKAAAGIVSLWVLWAFLKAGFAGMLG